MINSNTLGEEIRALRRKRNWTQGQLASAAGVHKNSIISFENGHRQMHTDTLVLLLDALGYEIELREKTKS